MLLGIDHLVIACRDLGAATAELEEGLGLEVGAGGRHEQLGTENRLVWLGDGYLELVAVFDPGLAAASWFGPSILRALEGEALEGEDGSESDAERERAGGLAAFALASDDLAGDVARLRAGGSSLGEPSEGQRTRPDGELVRWILAAGPALGPDQPPFLIEHQRSGAEWGEAATRERAAQVHPLGGQARLRRVELTVDDVAAVAARYRTTLGIAFGPPGAGIVEAHLGEQTIRLLPAGHDRPPAGIVIAISSGRPRQADLLGCRFTLELAEG